MAPTANNKKGRMQTNQGRTKPTFGSTLHVQDVLKGVFRRGREHDRVGGLRLTEETSV